MLECLARIESMASRTNTRLDENTREIQRMAAQQQRMESFIITNFPNGETILKQEPRDSTQELPTLYPQPSIPSEAHVVSDKETPQPVFQRPSVSSESQTETRLSDAPNTFNVEGEEEEEEEEEGGDAGPVKEPSIPVNHTTGASRLLLVPAILDLCGPENIGKRERNPLSTENARGLIHLYGRGEGNEHVVGYDRDSLMDTTTATTPNDTSSDVASPAGEEWGQIGGLTPPGNPLPEISGSVINREGMPNLTRERVLVLVESYKKHMNNMHPILIPATLDQLVEKFLETIPESQVKPKPSVAAHATWVGHKNPESPGNKRKRSPVSGDYADSTYTFDLNAFQKPGHPFRTVSTAVLLAVLALGEICLFQGKLPDVWTKEREVEERKSESSYTSSPIIRNGHPPSPLQPSPVVSTPMMASPLGGDRTRSRRSSVEGPGPYPSRRERSAGVKNMQFIPGLQYIGPATDILGNQLGGNTLKHIHASILVGLYYAQLGRILESHAWIYAACRALQVMLRSYGTPFLWSRRS